MQKRILLVLYVLISGSFSTYGQHQFAGTETSHHILLQKLEQELHEPRNNAYILYTLAGGNSKSLMDIRLHYRFNSSFFIPYTQNPLAEINLHISGFSLTGDTFYRGFDLSEWLIPDRVESEFTIHLTTGQSLHQDLNFSLKDPQWPKAVALFEKDAGQQISHIRLHIEQLSFSNEATSAFTERITRINDYRASIHLIDRLLQMIEQDQIADSDQPDELLLYWDLSRKVSRLSQESLQLFEGSEPDDQLNELFERLSRMQTRLHTLLIGSIGQSASLAGGSAGMAQAFVDFLAQRRQVSSRVRFQDAELFYKAGRLMPDDALVEIFDLINRKYNPDRFVERVYSMLIKQGDAHRGEDDLARAFDYFEDAMLLSRFFTELGPDPQLHHKLERVQEGMLNSYFRIAARAVESGNEQLAHEYQSKATAFMHDAWGNEKGIFTKTGQDLQGWVESHLRRLETLLQNQQFTEAARLMSALNRNLADLGYESENNKLSGDLSRAYRRVYMHFVVEAEKHHAAGQHTRAAESLQNAMDFRLQNMNYLSQSDEARLLQQEINEPVVNAVIDKGITAIQQGQADVALNSFMAAREQARRYELTYGYRLDSLTSLAAKPILLDHLRTAHLKIWANELDSAWAIYEDADMLRERFMLKRDPVIQAAFSELDRRFIERICLNHQFDFDELIDKMKRAEKEGRLMDIYPLVQQAEPIPVNNPGCGIEDEPLQAIKLRYAAFFDYQREYEHVLELLYQRGFTASIESYLKLDARIENFELERFGYKHTFLDDFVLSQGSRNLMLMALQRFIELGLPEKTLQYLQMLYESGYDERASREIQAEAAALLAGRDHGKGWVAAPGEKAEAYVGTSSWYRQFRRSYGRSINQLQRRQ